jgi:hypothetical protein
LMLITISCAAYANTDVTITSPKTDSTSLFYGTNLSVNIKWLVHVPYDHSNSWWVTIYLDDIAPTGLHNHYIYSGHDRDNIDVILGVGNYSIYASLEGTGQPKYWSVPVTYSIVKGAHIFLKNDVAGLSMIFEKDTLKNLPITGVFSA